MFSQEVKYKSDDDSILSHHAQTKCPLAAECLSFFCGQIKMRPTKSQAPTRQIKSAAAMKADDLCRIWYNVDVIYQLPSSFASTLTSGIPPCLSCAAAPFFGALRDVADDFTICEDPTPYSA
jgi:hypothetical protein